MAVALTQHPPGFGTCSIVFAIIDMPFSEVNCDYVGRISQRMHTMMVLLEPVLVIPLSDAHFETNRVYIRNLNIVQVTVNSRQ